MGVLLPNCALAVARMGEQEDAFGDRVSAGQGPTSPAHPGNAVERSDGTWSLALDAALWPIREHDLVIDPAGRQWVVVSSSVNRNPLVPEIDFVQVEAVEKAPSGVEPGGSYFVGRSQ